MALPDYQSLMLPLLRYAGDGTEKHMHQAIDAVAREFSLTEDDRAQRVPSGKQTTFGNRMHWARTYLDKAGAIKKTRRLHFQITDRGKLLLHDHPDRIDVKVLRQFPEFRAFQSPKEPGEENDEDKQEIDLPSPASISSVTPEEAIDHAEKEISSSLRAQLIERVSEMKPSLFEQLVVDLIVAMGYGGSRESVAQKIGKSGDEGIDGIINEDPLGLDVVYIQAKRYNKDNSIGRERIQQFSGALAGKAATKGVFVTTSAFTKGAMEYAQRVHQRIILIDGEELTNLMLRYGVGVRNERTITIKRLDTDYFEESEIE